MDPNRVERDQAAAGGSCSRLVAEVASRHQSIDSQAYLRFHAARYELLLRCVRSIVEARETVSTEGLRILDVGAAYQTDAIRMLYPNAVVDTLGFFDHRFAPRAHEHHIEFDLNDSDFADRWPELGAYDLVVFAEVLEHLHVAPGHVMSLMRSALGDGGSLLLQTPNAARLRNRLELLRGRNPFEPIRSDRSRAGHFREYTELELKQLATDNGFRVVESVLANHFFAGSAANRVFSRIEPLIPRRLRTGITLWLTRQRRVSTSPV